MVFHAQALVPTRKPYEHAVALAEHLGLEFETEWSAGVGFIKLPDGVCDMYAWPEGLRLDAFSEGHEGLAHVEELVKRNLERASGDEPLAVDWHLRPMSSYS